MMRWRKRPWYVSVAVEGLNLSRFISQAGEQGIRLRRVRRKSLKHLTAGVREDQLPALQELAFAGGWTVSSGRRLGAGQWLQRLYQRWMLTAAMCMGVIVLAACSKVVWYVEVVGGGPYQADIRSAVAELGIRPPVLRHHVDLGALRDALEWRYPRLAWVECGWRGTGLIIRAVEGELPDQPSNPDVLMDVIADRDGIVDQIVTVAGTPMVKPGDVVREGAMLIRGEERTSDGNVKLVSARGSVKARVWVKASIRMPATETITDYTGNTEKVWTIRTPCFDLWPVPECTYDQYDTSVSETTLSSLFFPVRVRHETRMEAEITSRLKEREALEGEAFAAAALKLKEKISPEESLIDIWGNCSMIDHEEIVSVAVGELITEIGRRVPASGMAAPGENQHE